MVWTAILWHPSLKELPVFPIAMYFLVYILLSFVHLYAFGFCHLNMFRYIYVLVGHFDTTSVFLCEDLKIKSARTFEEWSEYCCITYYGLHILNQAVHCTPSWQGTAFLFYSDIFAEFEVPPFVLTRSYCQLCSWNPNWKAFLIHLAEIAKPRLWCCEQGIGSTFWFGRLVFLRGQRPGHFEARETPFQSRKCVACFRFSMLKCIEMRYLNGCYSWRVKWLHHCRPDGIDSSPMKSDWQKTCITWKMYNTMQTVW